MQTNLTTNKLYKLTYNHMKNLQISFTELIEIIAEMIEKGTGNYDTIIAKKNWKRYFDKQTSFSSSPLEYLNWDFYHRIQWLTMIDENAQEGIDNWLSYKDLAIEYIDRKTWNL